MSFLGLAESFKTMNRPGPAQTGPTQHGPTQHDVLWHDQHDYDVLWQFISRKV